MQIVRMTRLGQALLTTVLISIPAQVVASDPGTGAPQPPVVQVNPAEKEPASAGNADSPKLPPPPPAAESKALPEKFDDKNQMELILVTPEAKPGAKVTVDIRSAPNAVCTLRVRTPGVVRRGLLKRQIADSDGLVSWTWLLGKHFKRDKIQITATSSVKGHEEKVDTFIPVMSIAQNTRGTGM